MSKSASTLKTTIAMTGGGTAGHVMPHLAMIDAYTRSGWDFFYIGSAGIEKSLAEAHGIPFYCIQSGKLRRYFSIENFTDLFKIFFGLLQSVFILLRKRPSLVFSKGGYVSVPVCVAAWILRIPVVTHESDFSPGLATKLILPFAAKVFYSFPQTGEFLPAVKCVYTGTPVRANILVGSRQSGLQICGFKSDRAALPNLLVMGGSLGAKTLNESLVGALPQLLQNFNVVHITGKGKVSEDLLKSAPQGYKAFEFVHDELKHIFAMTDIVLARSGANSIFEFLTLKIPMILVPLERGSRGDQLLNAQSFAREGWAVVVAESKLNPSYFVEVVKSTFAQRADICKNQENYTQKNPAKTIAKEFLQLF